VLGIPFYGRGWTGCGSPNDGLNQTCGGPSAGTIANGIHEYDQLAGDGWIGGNGFVRRWSETSKVPTLYKKTTGTFISYEDPESIGYKAAYIRANKLGGAMAWELSQDTGGRLLDALVSKLRQP